MSTNTPDCWVVVRITSVNTSVDKVLAGWHGGYLDGDSWKLSSGVVRTEEFDDRYEFTNHSGSLYVCYKTREQMSGIMSTQYSYYEKMLATLSDPASIEIIQMDKQ